eukprot:gene24089-31297_t
MITVNVTCASCLECGDPSDRWVALIPSSIGNMVPPSEFYSCSLIGVIIPTTVQIISISAFENSNLESIVIPTSVLWIGNKAFYKTVALTTVLIPTSVSSIGQYSFSYSALGSIILPFSTTFVGGGAFQGGSVVFKCKNLTTVDIQSAPGSSRMYESWVFRGDSALQCVFADPSDFDTVAASCQVTCPLIRPCSQDPSPYPTSYPTVSASSPTVNPADTAAPQSHPSFYPTTPYPTTPYPSFAPSSPAINVTCELCTLCGSQTGPWIAVIPSTATGVQNYAFSSCSLIGVVIPTSVRYIGSYAFYGTTALKSVVIPTSVYSIGQYAFRRSALESLTIPSSVSVLSLGAFQGGPECQTLTTVDIQYSPFKAYSLQVLNGVFQNDSALQCVFADPSDFEKVKASCKGSCPLISSCSHSPSLRSTYYPSSSTVIPTTTAVPQSRRPTTYPTPNPATLNPSSVAPTPSPGTYYVTCKLCSLCGSQSGIWVAIIPSLQSFAFSSCSLSGAIISTTIKYISGSAFANSSLQTVTVPKSVTAIGPSAFEFCSKLSSVSLPTSLNYIYSYAFQNTGALKSIFIPTSSFLEIRSYSFYDSALVTVDLPPTLTYFDSSAFEGCNLQCVYVVPWLFTQVKESCSSSCPSVSLCSHPTFAPYQYADPFLYPTSSSLPTNDGLDFVAIFFIVFFGVVVLASLMVGYFWFHSRRRWVDGIQFESA